jgi:hypothetical protein
MNRSVDDTHLLHNIIRQEGRFAYKICRFTPHTMVEGKIRMADATMKYSVTYTYKTQAGSGRESDKKLMTGTGISPLSVTECKLWLSKRPKHQFISQ